MGVLNRINQAALSFLSKFSSKILGALIVLVAVSLLAGYSIYSDNISTPMSVKEFANTSVKIMNLSQTSGGSGSVYRSTDLGSFILTNNHVCELIKSGGYVQHKGRNLLALDYRAYTYHDLCLIRVSENLGVNIKIANVAPDLYERSLISGHPGLLPHVLTEGNFSGQEIIEVLMGFEKCTDRDQDAMCAFYGVKTILKKFEAQLVTGTILPGSSGSAVFNSDGEVAGVVFAGRSRELSYAYIIPHSFVLNFLLTANQFKVVKIEYSFSGASKAEESVCRKESRSCETLIQNLIWPL